jgi:protein gp37
MGDFGPRWTGDVRMVPEHLDDPIRWKRPRRIFVNSMSDLFHEKLTDDEIERVFLWLGVSAEDQENLDERVPELVATRAAVRFVSAEPLLGPIRFHDDWPLVDWVIVGGESGRNARLFDVEWARDIVRQCRRAGAAVFVKQVGANPFDSAERWEPRSKFPTHGPEIEEWGEDFAVREFPR